MVIGDNNLFEVGCRELPLPPLLRSLALQHSPDDTHTGIESPSIGDWNTFGIRSRVSPFVQVGSYCVVGAGCIVLPSPFPNGSPFTTPQPPELPPKTTDAALLEVPTTDTPMSSPAPTPSGSPAPASPSPASAPSPAPRSAQTPSDSLPDYTHVFGSENRRRKASGEGTGQAKALFVKHWEYLRETLPKHHKLKMF